MQKVHAYEGLGHYQWGNACDSWWLVDSPSLSIKHERMPPATEEQWHYHQYATQFFFVLKGVAVMETKNASVELKPLEGLTIQPGTEHRIRNTGDDDAEFIVTSQPSTSNDRINIG